MNDSNSELNTKIGNVGNYYIAYATNSTVAHGRNYVSITIPAGTYLIVGYFINETLANACAWLNGATDTNNGLYMKINDTGSFSKVVTPTSEATFTLTNLTGQNIVPCGSTYLCAIRLSDFKNASQV